MQGLCICQTSKAIEENHKYIKEFVKNHGRYNSKTDNNVPFEEIVADYLLKNGVIVVDANSVKRENPDYPPEHCFTVRECEECGELYEPFCEFEHICKLQNSYSKI